MMSDDLMFYILNKTPDNVHYIKRYICGVYRLTDLFSAASIATLIYYPNPNATKTDALQMRRTVATKQGSAQFFTDFG